jgi:two-component system, chemotaxis family, chemotaxis protein CheY
MEQIPLDILICDDSMLVRKKLKDLLEALGCNVLEASNGLEGFEIYKNNKPDVVFMDIVMPNLDGLESLKRIREFDTKAKVVMLSSVGTSTKLKDALKMGAVDFIQKPYEDSQIVSILTKFAR